MNRPEWIGWLLAVVCCVILPLVFGHWREAIAGTGGLAVLWWLLRKDGLL